MKIKLAEIKRRHQVLCMIGNKKLPIKLSFAIGKNIMKFQEELDSVEKARLKLIEQYVEKDGDGNLKVVNGKYDVGENEEKINKEFVEFLESETEIDFYTIPIETIELLEDVRYDALSPADMITIDFMLEQPQTPEFKEAEIKA